MGCDIHGFLEIRQKSWICLKEIPKIRCYDIFGILAGVRNYINAKPISAPKGIPEDASEEALEKINMWVFYGHSYSWLDWHEIKSYNWNQKFKDRKLSKIDKKTGKELSKALYFRGITGETEKGNYKYRFLERTAENIAEKCGWKEFFVEMKKLAMEYGEHNVRIIFWFDN